MFSRINLVSLFILCLGLAPVYAQSPDTCGKQRTLFLSCSDPTGLEGPSLDRLPSEVDQLVRANSDGKAWLESVALVRVPLSEPILGYLQRSDGLAQLQQAAFRAAGPQVDLRTFSRIVLLVPSGRYEVAGEGTVGKSCLVCQKGAFMASTAWVFVPSGAAHSDLIRSVLHELGHGFGFHHGRSGTDTYGDCDDIMGRGYEHYGAQWRWQAGWLDAPLAEEAGEYRLPRGGVLRVRLPGSHDSYFLEDHDDELQVHLLTEDSVKIQQTLTEGRPLVDTNRKLKIVLNRKDEQGSVVQLVTN